MRHVLNDITVLKKLCEKQTDAPIDFSGIANVLCDLLNQNIFIIGRRGSILARAYAGNGCSRDEDIIDLGKRFPERYLEELNHVDSAKKISGCLFEQGFKCSCGTVTTIIVPIISGTERLGSLVAVCKDNDFTEEELITAEYASLAIGMEIMRMINERTERSIYQNAAIQTTLKALTPAEINATGILMNSLTNNERIVAISKIADEVELPRGAVALMMGKLDCAGIFTIKPQGPKGIFIKLVMPEFREALNKHLLSS